ncbi:kinase-like protein [Thermothelomyces thermophilus ATCC 42464]|uniref:Kinase-like protein n=1 Tax=Thermothelomyces thermophilus (strain ATCC 42464 / BCRC 31852 / DSM 1799) TaxID=573729 RepID=G2QG16_THET4|nr:kinase-like protein [Thermothelomyces thermophilus ATCC 42464]AEO58481.1 kinase-like protein [Thermothelomyces thermophilus ATCC 42464]
MYFNRLAHTAYLSRLGSRNSLRMASTILGASGREYIQGEVLQRDPKDNKARIFKAGCGNESFVFKHVSQPFYDLSQHLALEFAGSSRLRVHVDANQDERILVYPYFRNTLLALIKEDPDFPPAERVKVLRVVAEAIQELHSKDWIHNDVKPDNILVDWACDEDGNKTVTKAALGDFDIALKLEGAKPLYGPHAVGNAMWRSPEAQTGRGVTKASDVFSFGLVCIYALGGGDFLLPHNYEELVERGISPEQEILTRHFAYFGPVTEGLLKQIDSEVWSRALKAASRTGQLAVEDDPLLRFERWGEGLGPAAVDMISGMTRLDPAARMTMEQVLEHPWWTEE